MLVDRAANVITVQNCEDVRLQAAEEKFQAQHGQADYARDHTCDVVHQVALHRQQVATTHHENQHQEVSGKHVGKETDTQRQRTSDEDREDLHWDDQCP